MADLANTLTDRERTYGNFMRTAQLASDIKAAMTLHMPNTRHFLDVDQLHALEMIAVKIARILNGNPKHADSWHDIAGYAELVAKRLSEKESGGG